MLLMSVFLWCLAGFLQIALAAKYMRADGPVDYHAAIIGDEPLGPGTRTVMTALYRVTGGAYAALGLTTIIVAVWGVGADAFWPKGALLILILSSGLAAGLTMYRVERGTGVRTPWRVVASITGVGGLAFVLSII